MEQCAYEDLKHHTMLSSSCAHFHFRTSMVFDMCKTVRILLRNITARSVIPEHFFLSNPRVTMKYVKHTVSVIWCADLGVVA